MGNEGSNKLEWRINLPDGKSEILVPQEGLVLRVWLGFKGLIKGLILKVWNFLVKAWNIGVAEPKKAIHGVKVGLALSLVSLLYYMRPLYDGFGGNAMWAIMTVVVVFEYTVGATLCKCINRAIGTFVAGALGIGVHWIATLAGDKLEPIILGFSVFIFASAATFSRFVPSIKARFDYGAMIFILTFSLVSVSGYRVDKLLDLAHQRVSTIVVGAALCIITSILFCPIWAGGELHSLIHRNLEKLADSLDGSVTGYFTDVNGDDCSKKKEGYKCVLNSKATEDTMANFARWEPAHGRFNFRHPWKQYQKVGAALRSCAYYVETLNGSINSQIQAPEYLKKHLSTACLTLSSYSSNVLKELAITIKTMTMSSKIDIAVGDMQFAVQELQTAFRSLPNCHNDETPSSPSDENDKTELISKTTLPPIMEVLPLATLVSLMVEAASRIEELVDAVNELASLAEFKPATSKKANQNQPDNILTFSSHDHQTMKAPSKV